MIKLIFFFLILFKFTFAFEYTKNEGANIRLLNKSTTKNYELIIPLGQSIEFGDLELKLRDSIKKSLLKYCELDTMAMVMIFEHFLEKTK